MERCRGKTIKRDEEAKRESAQQNDMLATATAIESAKLRQEYTETIAANHSSINLLKETVASFEEMSTN